MSDLWTDIDPVSDSSDDGSIDEGIKDQDNADNKEQKEVASGTCMNLRSLIWGYQRSLILLKSDIEK